jgi:hypothetical protein
MEDVKTWLSYRHHTSLEQAYKNLFPDVTSASISAVITLRSSLSMNIFFVHNKFCFLGQYSLLADYGHGVYLFPHCLFYK